jgi:V-type H+-transporting ATPase subunit F
MAQQSTNPKGRNLIAVIGDEVSAIDAADGAMTDKTGLCDGSLVGWYWTCGQSTEEELFDRRRKYVSVAVWRSEGRLTGAETQTNVIESAFQDYTERKDIAILLINQHVSTFTICLAYADDRLPRG